MRNRIFQIVASCLVVWTSLWCSHGQAWGQGQQQEARDIPMRLARFDVDATPEQGFMMAYDPVVRREELGLRCRGIVLLGQEKPVVLCAVDWIGIGNGGHDFFREKLAQAAGTTSDRVVVHTLHQHDAPRCDLTAEQLINHAGLKQSGPHDGSLARDVVQRASKAIQVGLKNAETVTHVAFGTSQVKQVASNRRILDGNGKVRATRYTTCRDPALRAEPDGVIDPDLNCVTFWAGDKPITVLSYYACHPQSYYRTGVPSPDFPGIARFMRGQDVPNVLHVHFNGAGGNIGAGKYNDGAKENRLILARRVAEGMRQAYEAAEKFPVTGQDLGWATVPVSLPPAAHLKLEELKASLAQWKPDQYWGSPDKLAWLMRCREGHQIDLACLKIGDVRVLHMPGELFVEYQLAAKAMRPDLKVAMAAYGDYGPGYIGTEIAYSQGGYETSQPASNVAPEVETVLMDGMHVLLETGRESK